MEGEKHPSKWGPLLRTLGWLALALWGISLFAPYRAASFYDQSSDPDETGTGYFLFLGGWLGPIGFNFAWFANLPFALGAFRLVRGHPPGRTASLVTMILGYSALIPHRELDSLNNWKIAVFIGPAVYLWLIALSLVMVGYCYTLEEGADNS